MHSCEWIYFMVLLSTFCGIVLTLVHRAEQAAERAEAIAQRLQCGNLVTIHEEEPIKKSPGIVRRCARWGAEVLLAISKGETAEEAVYRSSRRVYSQQDEWETASEASTEVVETLGNNADDWIAHARAGVTPTHDANAMVVHRPVAHRRRASSPT